MRSDTTMTSSFTGIVQLRKDPRKNPGNIVISLTTLLSQIASSAFLDKEKPDIVYIGTGQFGDLPITSEALLVLAKFKSIIRPTPEIMNFFSSEYRSFAAILHVKC